MKNHLTILVIIFLCSTNLGVTQITKKTPRSINQNKVDTLQFNWSKNSLSNRDSLIKLTHSNYNFETKKKIQLTDETNWYALEFQSDTVYWNNVDCSKINIEFHTGLDLDNSKVFNFLQQFGLIEVIDKSMFPEIQNFYQFKLENGNKKKILEIVTEAKQSDFIKCAEPNILIKNKMIPRNDTSKT